MRPPRMRSLTSMSLRMRTVAVIAGLVLSCWPGSPAAPGARADTGVAGKTVVLDPGHAGGNDGNNLLSGGAGVDTLIGGLGNDTYIVDMAADVVTESSTLASEIDIVQSSVNYTLGANLEQLVLTGTGNINGTGNNLVNTLTGNAGNNILDGGAAAQLGRTPRSAR